MMVATITATTLTSCGTIGNILESVIGFAKVAPSGPSRGINDFSSLFFVVCFSCINFAVGKQSRIVHMAKLMPHIDFKHTSC